MELPEVKPIALDPKEAMLLKQVEEEFSRTSGYTGKAASELFKSLQTRHAIPPARLDYFIKPFPGGRGKSHRDFFARGESLFEDPNFVSYLRYFIEGPALPTNTIEGFRRILIDNLGATGMVMNQLCAFVRQETRRLRLERHTAREEFWKLAQEVAYPHADAVRNAAASGAVR